MREDEFSRFLRLQEAALARQTRSFIAIEETLKVQGQYTPTTTTRTGNSVKVAEPPLGSSFSAAGLGYSNAFVGERYRIINVDEKDKMSNLPGSWVLSLSSQVTSIGPTGPSIRRASNLLAKISFGVGGTTQEVEVDANENLIALPSNTLCVDVGQSPYAPVDFSGAVGPNNYFQEETVTATAYRSTQGGQFAPTRSYWVLGDSTDTIQIPIPPFAREWTYMPVEPVESGDEPLQEAIVYSAGTFQVLDTPVPEVLTTMARMHCFRALPPNSQSGFVQVKPGVGTWYGQLVFRLGL